MTPTDPHALAENLYEEIGGDLCICQNAEVLHWCETCQRKIDLIATVIRKAGAQALRSQEDEELLRRAHPSNDTHGAETEPRPNWPPSDSRVRCVNCRWLSESNAYTYCGNDDGPIGHVNFGCGDDVANEIRNVWCSGFEPQDWLAKQGSLFGYHGNQPLSEASGSTQSAAPKTHAHLTALRSQEDRREDDTEQHLARLESALLQAQGETAVARAELAAALRSQPEGATHDPARPPYSAHECEHGHFGGCSEDKPVHAARQPEGAGQGVDALTLIENDVHDLYVEAMTEDNEFARERESSYANVLEAIREHRAALARLPLREKEEHDPLCSEGEVRGDQVMSCDCDLGAGLISANDTGHGDTLPRPNKEK